MAFTSDVPTSLLTCHMLWNWIPSDNTDAPAWPECKQAELSRTPGTTSFLYSFKAQGAWSAQPGQESRETLKHLPVPMRAPRELERALEQGMRWQTGLGEWLEMKEGRFRLDLWKFFLWGWWIPSTEEPWLPNLWKYSGPGWTWLWAIWSSGKCPCCWQSIGSLAKWSLLLQGLELDGL